MNVDAIVCHPDDAVATAVRDLASGESIWMRVGDGELVVRLQEPVPFGHKFALHDIASGREVVKYGETIGRATSAIRQGEHVHLHNVEGLRGRGDLR